VIGASGAILGSAVVDNSLGNVTVGNCIADVVRTWTMPPPPDGSVVTVNYPFTFEPDPSPRESPTRFDVARDL
jgi:hypothetical protein